MVDYKALIDTESINDIISYLSNNSIYKHNISQYYARSTPLFSFIKAIHFQNNKRWNILTLNIDNSLKRNIEKIQQSIDVKNTLLISNLLPNFRNDQKIDLESFFTNLNFGGTISFYNWNELSKDFTLHNFLGKTVLLAPPIHNFFSKLQNNFDKFNLNLTAIKEISNFSFKNEDALTDNLTLNLLGFDMILYVIRLLVRFQNNLVEENSFQRLKDSLIPWNNVKTFIGKGLFNVEKLNSEILSTMLERVVALCKKYGFELPPKINQMEELIIYDDITSEMLILKSKLAFLKKESFKENQLGKLYYVLMLLIQEIENLSLIFFGKLHGIPNENIISKVTSFL